MRLHPLEGPLVQVEVGVELGKNLIDDITQGDLGNSTSKAGQ